MGRCNLSANVHRRLTVGDRGNMWDAFSIIANVVTALATVATVILALRAVQVSRDSVAIARETVDLTQKSQLVDQLDSLTDAVAAWHSTTGVFLGELQPFWKGKDARGDELAAEVNVHKAMHQMEADTDILRVRLGALSAGYGLWDVAEVDELLSWCSGVWSIALIHYLALIPPGASKSWEGAIASFGELKSAAPSLIETSYRTAWRNLKEGRGNITAYIFEGYRESIVMAIQGFIGVGFDAARSTSYLGPSLNQAWPKFAF